MRQRIHTAKSLKYDKRKPFSNSPVRRLSPPPGKRDMLSMRSLNPYPGEKYPISTGSTSYVSPTRKKIKREPIPYGNNRLDVSPPRRNGPPIDHLSRRDAHPHMIEKRRYSPIPAPRQKQGPIGIPRNHAKEPQLKAPRSPESRGRYVSPSLPKGFPSSGPKSLGPTLHERFSSVSETNRSEAPVKYSREDLEKITIDIRRNLRETSPTVRRIINPADVKLVRRPSEGRQPIFDRDEIKHAQRDLREDSYYERKRMERDPYRIDVREFENYQITRHRFDRDRDLHGAASGRTLNDRWQNTEDRKEYPTYDRDLRQKEFVRRPSPRAYAGKRSRSRSADRDFRTDRYVDSKSAPNKSEYPRRIGVEIPPPRNNALYPPNKGVVSLVGRQKIGLRKSDIRSPAVQYGSKNNYSPPSDRQYIETVSSTRVERRDAHSPISNQKWAYKGRSGRSSSSPERAYPRPPEKSYSKNWNDKPTVPSRGSNFFESERRESSSSYSRGGSRPFQSPRGSSRGRGYRGSMRGGSSFRGSFRGGSSSSRGRGMIRR